MPFDPITGKWIPADPMGAAAGWDWGDLPPGSVGGEIYPSLLAERTMEEVASQFAADLPTDPRWRRGFRSMMPRLAGQYLLSSPYMQPMGAEGSPYGASFAQYLSDIGGTPSYRADPTVLRQRAQTAGAAAMAGSLGAGQIAGDPISTLYAGIFGRDNPDYYQNQILAAQALARQRPQAMGGGVYRGMLGQAMDRAVRAIAAGRLATGAPKTSFLDWYSGIPQIAAT